MENKDGTNFRLSKNKIIEKRCVIGRVGQLVEGLGKPLSHEVKECRWFGS